MRVVPSLGITYVGSRLNVEGTYGRSVPHLSVVGVCSRRCSFWSRNFAHELCMMSQNPGTHYRLAVVCTRRFWRDSPQLFLHSGVFRTRVLQRPMVWEIRVRGGEYISVERRLCVLRFWLICEAFWSLDQTYDLRGRTPRSRLQRVTTHPCPLHAGLLCANCANHRQWSDGEPGSRRFTWRKHVEITLPLVSEHPHRRARIFRISRNGPRLGICWVIRKR